MGGGGIIGEGMLSVKISSSSKKHKNFLKF
jgi:hypothetical protein